MSERKFIVDSSSVNISGIRCKSDTPMNACQNAADKVFQKTKSNKITLSIRETTKGSKKKTYTYIATRKQTKKGSKITVCSYKRKNRRGGEGKDEETTYIAENFVDAFIKFLQKIIDEDTSNDYKVGNYSIIHDTLQSVDEKLIEKDFKENFINVVMSRMTLDIFKKYANSNEVLITERPNRLLGTIIDFDVKLKKKTFLSQIITNPRKILNISMSNTGSTNFDVKIVFESNRNSNVSTS